jgi:hypothetical protein
MVVENGSVHDVKIGGEPIDMEKPIALPCQALMRPAVTVIQN